MSKQTAKRHQKLIIQECNDLFLVMDNKVVFNKVIKAEKIDSRMDMYILHGILCVVGQYQTLMRVIINEGAT